MMNVHQCVRSYSLIGEIASTHKYNILWIFLVPGIGGRLVFDEAGGASNNSEGGGTTCTDAVGRPRWHFCRLCGAGESPSVCMRPCHMYTRSV
jgi:hypothetical protein